MSWSAELKELRVAPDASIHQTIATIAANRRQIALVLDADGRLLGVVTDGDIRRGILRGIDLGAPVTEIMSRAPHTALRGADEDEIADRMAEAAIRQMPVLDDTGRVTDLVTIDDLVRPAHTPVTVVLMAGGRGQRLLPLTENVPKPMLRIGDTPIIEIILRRLAAQGFVDVRISVNYLADVIIDHLGDGSRLGLRIQYVHEDQPLGTAGALAGLRDEITEPFVVMNADLLTRVNLRRMLSFHVKHGAVATVGVREHQTPVPFGVVALEGARVLSIVEKPVHRSLVNAGIYVLDPAVLQRLEPDAYADMPDVLSASMADGGLIVAFPIHELWLDIGRPDDLHRAQDDAARWAAP